MFRSVLVDFFYFFCMSFEKKKRDPPPPGADHRCKMHAAGLLGQHSFLTKYKMAHEDLYKILFCFFGQLSLQKSNSSLFGATFWKLAGNFLEKLEQLVESSSDIQQPQIPWFPDSLCCKHIWSIIKTTNLVWLRNYICSGIFFGH